MCCANRIYRRNAITSSKKKPENKHIQRRYKMKNTIAKLALIVASVSTVAVA
jgi:hypothetical protein